MNWYLVGNDLMRNSYVGSASSPMAGIAGIRDFSGTRVEPAPASSFDIPKGCPHVTEGADMLPNVREDFGDLF
jgi:hypothetical protein